MADYAEWTRKGATLSDVTAEKEYGVSREFIAAGIRAGKLEYRAGAVWGNRYVRVLRRQLEEYIAKEFGSGRLEGGKTATELRGIKTEIARLKRQLTDVEARKATLEQGLEG